MSRIEFIFKGKTKSLIKGGNKSFIETCNNIQNCIKFVFGHFGDKPHFWTLMGLYQAEKANIEVFPIEYLGTCHAVPIIYDTKFKKFCIKILGPDQILRPFHEPKH